MTRNGLEPLYERETLAYAKEKQDEVAELKRREHIVLEDASRDRDPYHRDYARVLYSSSFRRLQGKMQLLGIDQTHFHRNRLTHSLEVCQIAKGISERLKLNTSLVAETCSLAHDLGNPPFGHHGERVLDELVADVGGYEGNAQTLRILRKLERKHYSHRGLNLSLRTLLGVIKYDRKCQAEGENEKFVYDEDYADIHGLLDEVGSSIGIVSTIDMQVMNLADEIAYAAHDLEDCLNSNYFTIDDLLYEFSISDKFKEGTEPLKGVVKRCSDFAMKARLVEDAEEFSTLFSKEMTAQIVNLLIGKIRVVEDDGVRKLGYDEPHRQLAEGLKKLVFQEVLRRPEVTIYERRGDNIVRGLFAVYSDESFNKDLKLLPPEYRTKSEEDSKTRRIADYIGGMMDSFAIQQYQRYFGMEAYNRLYELPVKLPPSHCNGKDEN